MHRLDEFVNAVLKPRKVIYRELSANEQARLAETRAEIVEAFLWLHFGVELGAFPRKQGERVFEVFLRHFFLDLRGREEGSGRAHEEYVTHSDQSLQLIKPLPRYASILVEKAMRGDRDLFTSELSMLQSTERLQGLFQSVLGFYCSFATNGAAERFTYAISFAPEEVWKTVWAIPCTAEDVRKADELGTGSGIAQVLAGFLTFWNFAAKLKEAFDGFGYREGVSTSDLFKMRERVREILSWRINLSARYAADRFESVRRRILRELELETREKGLDRRCANLIENSIDEAFEFWNAELLSGVLA